MKVHVRVKHIEDKIAEYVENHPNEIYVDYRDELSQEQVDKILEGKIDEVRWAIEENSYDDDLSYYWEECKEETGCTLEDIEDWLANDGFGPSVYLSDRDWSRLLRNTTVNIVGIVWDAEWNFNNWAYGQPIEYRDVKESLKILGIDPYEFRQLRSGGSMTSGEGNFKGYFPKMPNREPKVNIEDLYNNMCVLYDGYMHFCLGDLEEVAEVLSSKSKYITFKKGTNVVFYDRMNGAGITEVQLTGDVKIARKKVEFRNDTNNTYGVQACYGFVQSYWTEGSVQNEK